MITKKKILKNLSIYKEGSKIKYVDGSLATITSSNIHCNKNIFLENNFIYYYLVTIELNDGETLDIHIATLDKYRGFTINKGYELIK